MINKLLSSVFCTLLSVSLFAQIPDGSIAPNFTLTDFDGMTHTLYDVLDDDRSVIIDFSATWCGICWNYHQGHAIEDTYQTYGPSGMNSIMAYFIEADANTNDACVTNDAGCSSSTIGDWTNGTSYPVFNLTGDDLSVKSEYGITGYPTIIAIAPNKKLYETGRINTTEWSSWITETLALSATFTTTDNSIDVEVENGFGEITFLWSNGETTEDLEDLPAGFYSVTITESRGHSIELEDIEIIGGAASISCPPGFSTQCTIDNVPPIADAFEWQEQGGVFTGDVDFNTFMLVSEETDASSCPEIITRTYSIEDLDGNVITCTRSITVNDDAAPLMFPPINTTIDEAEIPNSYFESYSDFISNGGIVNENCGLDTSSFALVSDIITDEICPQITRVYQISDNCGNIATSIQQISVNLSEDAFIDFTQQTADKSVEFTSVTDFAESYSWDFGDGNVSTEMNPTYEYSDYGTYTVCVTGTISCGEKTVCQDVTLTENIFSLSCPAGIDISCDITTIPPYSSLQEYMDAGGTVTGDIEETSFTLISEESNGNSCPEIITRVYQISDENGLATTCSQFISISDEIAPTVISPADMTISNDEKESSTYNSVEEFVNAGGQVFDNCELDSTTFLLITESSNSETYCEHITREYGIADKCGNPTTVTQIIDIELLPTAALSFSSVITALQIDFTSSSDFATEYLWDFGDGNTSTEANPTHTYDLDGSYEVCLTGSISCGSITTCQTLQVMSVGTDESFLNYKISVYPSPVRDNFTLEIDESLDIRAIELLTSNGMSTSINVQKNHTQRLHISSLSSGLYIIKIETTEGIAYKKIIITK